MSDPAKQLRQERGAMWAKLPQDFEWDRQEVLEQMGWLSNEIDKAADALERWERINRDRRQHIQLLDREREEAERLARAYENIMATKDRILGECAESLEAAQRKLVAVRERAAKGMEDANGWNTDAYVALAVIVKTLDHEEKP